MKHRSCSYEALEVCSYKAHVYVWDVSESISSSNWGEGRFYADFTGGPCTTILWR
jgi:hypothetical protein